MEESSYQQRRRWLALRHFIEGLSRYIIVGALVALVLAAIFGLYSSSVGTNTWAGFDTGVQNAVRGWQNPALDLIFTIGSIIGGSEATIILAIITAGWLAWRHRYRMATLLVMTALGGLALNQIFKQFFQRPRPTFVDAGSELVNKPSSFSYPSAHATSSMCFFGMLAFLGYLYLKRPLWRWLWVALMALIIASVGLSRIYFGFHYPSDIIGGYILGGFWLFSLIIGVNNFRRRKKPNVTTNS